MTIDDLRLLAIEIKDPSLKAKVKTKLGEFGVKNITALDPTNYEEMYNFIKELC